MKTERINALGAAARRVPGVPALLDARVRRRERRPTFNPRHERRRLEQALAGTGLRLNIGAGVGSVAGWLNIDLTPVRGALVMDATEPWPIADGAADAVNSEHVIEHIDPPSVPSFFAEAHRALRPGGVIRTSTPDLRGLAEAYLEGAPDLLEAHRSDGYEARNHADMLNNYVYSWGHVHIYDYESLVLLLDQAGFESIERAHFGESSHEILRGIDTHDAGDLDRTVVTVDAVRPG